MDFLTTFDDVTKELKKYGASLIKIDKSHGLYNLNNEFIICPRYIYDTFKVEIPRELIENIKQSFEVLEFSNHLEITELTEVFQATIDSEAIFKNLKQTIRRADCGVDEALEICKEFIKWHINDINKFFS